MQREQAAEPASGDRPVVVLGGRIRDPERAASVVCAGEVLAHESGYTGQARPLGILYSAVVASLRSSARALIGGASFENQASADGQFGGLVNGSVCAELMTRRGTV